MSSQGFAKKINDDFAQRLIELCDSAQPADVARILNISYQAAKNYLSGRLPDSSVLLLIAERTPYSIHWLLTGQGEKFVEPADLSPDTLLASGALRSFVRRECLQIVGEMLNNEAQIAEIASRSRVVVLTPDKIRQEKAAKDFDAFPSKQQ
jgi:hypothetical protein